MTMYALHHDALTGRYLGVTRTADGAQIPPDPANGDYAAFLRWNAEQVPPLDLSDRAGESDAQRVQRLAGAALMDTLARGRVDPFAAAMLSLFDLAFTLINDLRERNGDARLPEAALVPLAVQALIVRQGGGAPVPPPEP